MKYKIFSLLAILVFLISFKALAVNKTPTDYAGNVTGRLTTEINSTKTTSIKVTADTYRTASGSSPVTFPTGEMILRMHRKFKNTSQVECMAVESGTTQSDATVTLGTVTRNIPCDDGSIFTSNGTALSFPAGSFVEMTWGAHQAENTVFKDNTTTFTLSGAIRGNASSLEQPLLNAVAFTQTQINAFESNTQFDIAGNSTTGTLDFYDGSSWLQIATSTGALPNAGFSTRGVSEYATPSEIFNQTASGSTNAGLVIAAKDVVKHSDDWTAVTNESRVVATSGASISTTVGGTGSGQLTLSGVLVSNGTNPVKTVQGASSGNFLRFDQNLNPISTSSKGGSTEISCVETADSSGITSSSFVSVFTCAIPANTLAAGEMLEVSYRGAPNGGGDTFETKLLVDTQGLTFESHSSTVMYRGNLVIRGAGAAGTMHETGFMIDEGASSISATSTGSVTVDTTSSLTLDLQARRSAGSTRALTFNEFIVRKSNK